MANYEYVEDGTGDIAGVGIVYKGRVVAQEEVSLDLSEDPRFQPVDTSASSREEITSVINGVPAPVEEPPAAGGEAVNSAPTTPPVSTPLPVSDQAVPAQPVEQSVAPVSAPVAPVTEA